MNQQEELQESYAAAPRGGMGGDGSRVLWGRVGALVFLVGWAFVLGRCSAPGGVPAEELRRVNQQLADEKSKVQRLQEQKASPSPSPSPVSENPSATPSPSPTSQTHIVKSGETLRGISLKYYKTPNLANVIAEANNLRGNQLRVGQELTIPPKPEAQNRGQ